MQEKDFDLKGVDLGGGGDELDELIMGSGDNSAAELLKARQDQTNTIDRVELVAKLPCGKHDPIHEEERKKMFNRFDSIGRGKLSLVDVTHGLIEFLGQKGKAMAKALSPAITRAFHAARDSSTGSGAAAEYVSRGEEFRLLLVYLKRYFELLLAYDRIDTSDDRRIDRKEFDAALPLLCTWGVTVIDPEAQFRLMDKDGGGLVLFDEFSGWALMQGLDMEPTDNVAGEEALLEHHKAAAQVASAAAKHTSAKVKEIEREKSLRKLQGVGDMTQGLNLREVMQKLPVGARSGEDGKRERMFKAFDINGNGSLSLSEVKFGLQGTLGELGPRATEAFAPAIKCAFHAAMSYTQSTGKDAEVVSKEEFRPLMIFLGRYFELLIMFDQVDMSDDRRLDRREFELALPLLTSWGVKVADPDEEFRKIDLDGSGRVRFDEFAGWALAHDLDLTPGDTRDNVPLNELEHNLASRHAGAAKHGEAPRPKAVLKDVLPGMLSLTPNVSLPALVFRLPCGRSELEKQARKELFAAFDSSGNGTLEPADVDAGMRALLDAAGRAVVDPPLPAIEFAFAAVARFRRPGERHVRPAEFRLLLCNLKWYSTSQGQSSHVSSRPSTAAPSPPRSRGGRRPRSPTKAPMPF